MIQYPITAEEIFTAPDWITPAWALLNDIIIGGGYPLIISDGGLTAHEIMDVLREKGVYAYAPMIVSDCLLITVEVSQAYWACRVLNMNGVTVDNPPERGR